MFFDQLAKKRFKLENDSTLFNTFQGRVKSTNFNYTTLDTPIGDLKVTPAAGDRIGSRRFHIKTSTGETDSPF